MRSKHSFSHDTITVKLALYTMLLVATLALTLVDTTYATEAPVSVKLELPIGSAGGVVSAHTRVYGALYIELEGDGPKNFSAVLIVPKALDSGLLWSKFSTFENSTHIFYVVKGVLEAAHDLRVIQFYVDTGSSGSYILCSIVEVNGFRVTKCVAIEVSEASGNVEVKVTLPVDEEGSFEVGRTPNVVVVSELLPPPLDLFIRQDTQSDLLTYVRFDVYGRDGKYLIICEFYDSSGKRVTYLAQNPHADPSVKYQIVVSVEGGHAVAVTPVYVVGDVKLVSSRYTMLVKVYRLGEAKPIAVEKVLFDVRVVEVWKYTLVVALGIVSAVLYPLILLRTVRRMSISDIATASSFAALLFVTVSVPGTVLLYVCRALLTVFDWVVTGILYGFATYMIYSALATVSRRPGSISLMLGVKVLLYALFFGVRNPITLVAWTATTALFVESMFWLVGVTRGKFPSALLVSAAAFLARALDAYVDLLLYMTLYRLFYANWYIMMYCIGTALYACAGAAAGYRTVRAMCGGDVGGASRD